MWNQILTWCKSAVRTTTFILQVNDTSFITLHQNYGRPNGSKNTWILTCKICVFNAHYMYYICISHAKCVLKSAHKLFEFTTLNMCIICLKYTWPSIQNCKISNRQSRDTSSEHHCVRSCFTHRIWMQLNRCSRC